MHHSRKTRKLYEARQKQKECPFCAAATLENSIKTTEYCFVVPNLTKYDFWEMRNVEDHLLIAPRRHVEGLKDTTKEEREDIMNLIAEYESKNYNIYARSVQSISRSVPHQHTHLIRLSNKQAKVVLFLQRPYFLFRR